MTNRPLILLIIGLLTLAAGGLLRLGAGPASADADLAARCRTEMASRGPDASSLAANCDEAAFATAITATDATSAAQSISAANRSEVGSSTLSMFLLGLGAVLTLGGVLAYVQRRA